MTEKIGARGFHATRVSQTGGGIKIAWGATHRNGICVKCHIRFEKYWTGKYLRGARYRLRIKIMASRCPNCHGTEGELISRQASIEPPKAPTCKRPSCLWQYLWDAWVYALVCTYHVRRAAYAEANRGKVILERYRTGEPSPRTMWQAIHANLKIRCPVCRRFDVDPLLGGNGHEKGA